MSKPILSDVQLKAIVDKAIGGLHAVVYCTAAGYVACMTTQRRYCRVVLRIQNDRGPTHCDINADDSVITTFLPNGHELRSHLLADPDLISHLNSDIIVIFGKKLEYRREFLHKPKGYEFIDVIW